MTKPIDRPKALGDAGYIPTLDGWRAIAVLLVVGAHSVGMLYNNGSHIAVAAAKLLSHAGYGVDIFFALSGFLITTILLSEKERVGTIDLRRFYIRRFFRIVPPMALYLAVITALPLPDIKFGEIAASLLFARNYIGGTWYTGHFWSLSIEEHFYAVVPLLILWLRPRNLLVACLGLIVACIVIR